MEDSRVHEKGIQAGIGGRVPKCYVTKHERLNEPCREAYRQLNLEAFWQMLWKIWEELEIGTSKIK